MLYDCFSFFNELDVLEIRLNTLKDVVDRFVLVEACWTHTGHAKSYIFEENKERFRPFLDRIIHIKLTESDLPPIPKGATEREIAWIRENTQRNAIVKGLTDAKPEDVLIIADLDEIPDPDVIRTHIDQLKGVTNLTLKNYAFFLNNLNVSYPNWSGGPQLLTVGTFHAHETYQAYKHSEYAPSCANKIPSATLIRFADKQCTVKNAGWHFSSMGGLCSIKEKLKSFAHTEFEHSVPNDHDLMQWLQNGHGLFGYGDAFMAEPVNESMPPFVLDNQKQFSQMLLPTDAMIWRKNRFRRYGLRFKKLCHDRAIALIIALTPRFLRPALAKIRKVFF